MNILLPVILAVGWAVTAVVARYRIQELHEANELLADGQREATEYRIDAERQMAVAQTENQYLKLTVQSILQRPAIVQMTDENIRQLGAILQGMLKPGGLN